MEKTVRAKKEEIYIYIYIYIYKKLCEVIIPRRGKISSGWEVVIPRRGKISSGWEVYTLKFFVIFLLLMFFR